MSLSAESEVPASVPSPGQGDESEVACSPVAEWVERPDFPKCTLGQCLNIGGYVGTVVAVVNQSLKVRSAEGTTRSFNAHGLRRIYGPRHVVEPPPSAAAAAEGGREHPSAESEPSPRESEPPAIEPDFTQPVRPVAEFAVCPDFPENTMGRFVDLGGYSGVVVQIVRQSLKVRSPAGITRSYNALALRKLHPPH